MAPSTPRQLSDGDAIFLSMETPEAGGHVGALLILDPPDEDFGFERLRSRIARRVALVPRFRWKLQAVPLDLDRPYWVEALDSDPADHIIRTAVPAPGTREQVNTLVARLHAQPLDRRRPLWEIWCIEGLEGGRFGVYMKTHHCLVDGAGGTGLGEILSDLSPDAEGPAFVPAAFQEEAPAPPSPLEMATAVLRNASQRPARMRHHLVRGLREIVRGARARLRDETTGEVERLSFNGPVGRRRTLTTLSLEFERVRNLKKHFDVKVNDVVLAIVDSAMRRWLRDRGEEPVGRLVAMCPVSTRGEEAGMGNEITAMVVPLGAGDAGPGERLEQIHRSASGAKEDLQRGSFDWTAAIGESLSPAAVQLLVRAAGAAADNGPLPANFVVSNVRATPMPVYLAGARVESIMPLSMLQVGQGLNVTLISYCDRIDIGIIADADRIDDLSGLPERFAIALDELEAAAEGVVFQRR